jgi:hypothetical protein
MRFRGSEGADASPGSESPSLPPAAGGAGDPAQRPPDGTIQAPLPAQTPLPGAERGLPPARREPLFFVVIILLVLDILLGLGIAVFAEKILEFRPMAVMGVGLAILGVGILAYFVLLGDGSARVIQKKRRAAALERERERERSAS